MTSVTAENILATWMSRVWNQMESAAIDELLAQDAAIHGLGPPLVGPPGFHAFHDAFGAAFSDIRITVEGQIVNGSEVAGRWTGTMVHRASGKPVAASGMAMLRMTDGQISEGWNSADFVPMLIELGFVAEDAMERALSPSG